MDMVKSGDTIFVISRESINDSYTVTTKIWKQQVTNDPEQSPHLYGFCTKGGNYVHHIAGRLFAAETRTGPFEPDKPIPTTEEAWEILKGLQIKIHEAIKQLPNLLTKAD